MTVLAQSFDPLVLQKIGPPRNPDRYVFGEPYPRGELWGWPAVRCVAHLAGWEGPRRCWCCAAGVPALKTD